MKHPMDSWAHTRRGPVTSLFSNLISPKVPKVSQQPIADTEEAKKKAKKSKVALLTTEGGILGSELAPGQVSKSDLLLGN